MATAGADPWVVDVEWSDRTKHPDGSYITSWVRWLIDPTEADSDTAATLLALQLTLATCALGGLVLDMELTL